jgi:hypothetical protein
MDSNTTRVNSEVSLEFARFDTSKPCDSHAIVMRERIGRGRAAGTDGACSGQSEKARASAVLADWGWVSRQRDEVKAMGASGTIARASLL